MKIIDLLNKILNGEKVPKHIKYLNLIWEYDDEIKDYINDDTCLIYHLNAFGLNDKIEIIEEPKKIEKINKILRIDDLEPPYNVNIERIWKNIIIQQNKLNEIIDYINRGDSDE